MPESINAGDTGTATAQATLAGAPVVANAYAWTETGGALTLSGADTSEVTFVGNDVPAETVDTLTVTVTNADGTTSTFSDTVNVFGTGPVAGAADAVTFTFGAVVPKAEGAETPVEEAGETETPAEEAAEAPATGPTFGSVPPVTPATQ
jgi:hypothetical protein